MAKKTSYRPSAPFKFAIFLIINFILYKITRDRFDYHNLYFMHFFHAFVYFASISLFVCIGMYFFRKYQKMFLGAMGLALCYLYFDFGCIVYSGNLNYIIFYQCEIGNLNYGIYVFYKFVAFFSWASIVFSSILFANKSKLSFFIPFLCFTSMACFDFFLFQKFHKPLLVNTPASLSMTDEKLFLISIIYLLFISFLVFLLYLSLNLFYIFTKSKFPFVFSKKECLFFFYYIAIKKPRLLLFFNKMPSSDEISCTKLHSEAKPLRTIYRILLLLDKSRQARLDRERLA